MIAPDTAATLPGAAQAELSNELAGPVPTPAPLARRVHARDDPVHRNPYELEARRAVADTRERAS